MYAIADEMAATTKNYIWKLVDRSLNQDFLRRRVILRRKYKTDSRKNERTPCSNNMSLVTKAWDLLFWNVIQENLEVFHSYK